MYRIHFTDNYGYGAIECDSQQDFNIAYTNILNDPMCEDIWCEYNDPEEGWQAL